MTIPIFDSHFHIIDFQFPLISNGSYHPPQFTCQNYLQRTKHLLIVGGAIVSASFQGFDQTYLLDSLKKLGPNFIGITQLPSSVSDEEILQLNKSNIRGVRFNLKGGGLEGIENLENFAKRIHDLAKWHIELYVDSVHLPELSKTLLKLPAVSIDHLGLSKAGFKHLLLLVEKGIKVKISGFGRVNFPIPDALKELAKINEEAMMFGTDLPSTRAPRPFSDQDIQLILDTFDSKTSKKILYANAIDFYRLNY